MVLLGARAWSRVVSYSVVALGAAVLHVVVLPWIAVAGIVPDVLLVLTVWIALREGQIAGMIAGFGCGLLLDWAMQGQLGLHAFAKTVAGFVGGLFAHPEDPGWLATVDLLRLMGILLLVCVLHNLLYFALFVHPLEVPVTEFVLKYAAATTGYTAVVAVLALLCWQLVRRRFTSER
ncbi:MAG: rod shape-determining protein MreD [Candidatus Kapabacteria bacterium]|nr:rod shape-determining protein MreD [Candidatus Kapabacteria bacterium]MDW8012105.1 rod shape-determining protein MreD [Bacteroidota bacterium]